MVVGGNLPVPAAALIPLIAGAGSLLVSSGANLYKQFNQRNLYSQQINAYKNLDTGYRQYLFKHGREMNPNRAWNSYFGQYKQLQMNMENSTASSVGTVAGTFGAGAMLGKGLYRGLGRTSRWL